MTITLSSGLSVRVSNDQLVLPNVYFDQQAGDILTNGTGPDLLIDSMQDVNANDMAQLGSMFLSSAYLQVNQDAGQFSLWAANPTSDEDLVAMDANDLESSDFCASSDQQNVDSGSNSSSTTPQSTNTSSSLSAASVAPLGSGTIVGIAVAVVALGAITGGVGFWLFKRKSRSNQSEPSVHPQTRIYNDPSKPSEAGSDYIPELMDQTPRTFEAPSKSSRAQPAHRYELSS